MAVFDRALTVADIQKYYNAALGIAPVFDPYRTVIDLDEFQTAADNGESPATSGLSNLPGDPPAGFGFVRCHSPV